MTKTEELLLRAAELLVTDMAINGSGTTTAAECHTWLRDLRDHRAASHRHDARIVLVTAADLPTSTGLDSATGPFGLDVTKAPEDVNARAIEAGMDAIALDARVTNGDVRDAAGPDAYESYGLPPMQTHPRRLRAAVHVAVADVHGPEAAMTWLKPGATLSQVALATHLDRSTSWIRKQGSLVVGFAASARVARREQWVAMRRLNAPWEREGRLRGYELLSFD